MVSPLYKYNHQELGALLKSLTIIVDTREQKNDNILDFFKKHNINFITKKLDSGDYSCYIPKNEIMGVYRDLYIPMCIERKNSVDELALSLVNRTRFENEFMRAGKSGYRIKLLIEDEAGYENILKGNYRSRYNAKAFLGSLKAFEARYEFSTIFINKQLSGHYMYHTLFYASREVLINSNQLYQLSIEE